MQVECCTAAALAALDSHGLGHGLAIPQLGGFPFGALVNLNCICPLESRVEVLIRGGNDGKVLKPTL